MMRYRRILWLFLALLQGVGCASKQTKIIPDKVATSSSRVKPVVEIVDDIHLDVNKEYLIKFHNRTFLDIIDRVGYLKRIGYTFSTSVPKDVLTVNAEGTKFTNYSTWKSTGYRQFKNTSELLNFMVDKVNEQSASCDAVPFPGICVENVDSVVKLARRIKSGRDPLSERLMTVYGDSIGLVISIGKLVLKTPGDDLVRSIRDLAKRNKSSASLKLDWILAQGVVEMLTSSDYDVRKNGIDSILVELIKPIIEGINNFIAAPIGDKSIVFDQYIDNPVSSLFEKTATNEAMSKRINRYIVEQLYADYLRVERQLKFRFINDGVEFYRDKDFVLNEPKSSFKKFFLYNINTDSAARRIYGIFGNQKTVTEEPEVPATKGVKKGKENDNSEENVTVTKKVEEGQILSIATDMFNLVTIPAQNALIIKGDTAIINNIGQMLFSIDSEFNTVLIETTVFEYSDSIAQKIGVALEYSKQNGNFKFDIKNMFGDVIGNPPLGPYSLIGAGFTDTEKKQNVLGTLAMYGRDGLVRIAAAPRLVLQPGQQAEVSLKAVHYYLTIPPVGGVGTIDKIDAGTSLKITPTILGSDKIQIMVELEQSEFLPGDQANVLQTSNTNNIKTTLIVSDGELVSLGGIKTRKTNKSNYGIPYLKDIPWLGRLFGTDENNDNSVNIEFMIRPTIKYNKGKISQVANTIENRDREELNKFGVGHDDMVQGIIRPDN